MDKLLFFLFLIFLLISCGDDGKESLPKDDMVLIPAGTFMMGCNGLTDHNCSSNELPYHEIYLDNYSMDKYEITVSQFQLCVDAGICSDENFLINSVDIYCNYGNSEKGNHPMNCINWYGAKQYCEWKGKRLPTEAEWEKGARGTDGRIYPWGNDEPTCEYAIMEQEGDGCGENSTWTVGTKPLGVSPYGLYDMSGNVGEWVTDYYSESYYENSPLNNPQGPDSGSSRVLRGAGWGDDLTLYFLRASDRYFGTPSSTYMSADIGFRCAKSVE